MLSRREGGKQWLGVTEHSYFSRTIPAGPCGAPRPCFWSCTCAEVSTSLFSFPLHGKGSSRGSVLSCSWGAGGQLQQERTDRGCLGMWGFSLASQVCSMAARGLPLWCAQPKYSYPTGTSWERGILLLRGKSGFCSSCQKKKKNQGKERREVAQFLFSRIRAVSWALQHGTDKTRQLP